MTGVRLATSPPRAVPLWRRRRVRQLLAIVAGCAQLTVLLATGADAWRGRDASAHVERGGTHLHYAHDESTCVACTTQTLHAQAAPRTMGLLDVAVGRSVAPGLAAVPPRSSFHTPDTARAPPRVI